MEKTIINRADFGEYDKLKAENEKLKELVIWMTGCGYDFCQHDYFIQQRDELLKGYGARSKE